MKYRLERDQFHRWVKNAVKFTAPALAVFFLQLAGGSRVSLCYWCRTPCFLGIVGRLL